MSKLPATDGRTQVASGSKNLLHRPKKSKEIQKEMKALVVTEKASVDLGPGDTCPDQSRPHCKFFGAISSLTITRVLTFFRLISTFV